MNWPIAAMIKISLGYRPNSHAPMNVYYLRHSTDWINAAMRPVHSKWTELELNWSYWVCRRPWNGIHAMIEDMPGSPVLSRQAPLYLADDCHLVSDSTRRSLRSADVATCSSYGDRTFTRGPRLWNSLPVQLRNPDITYGLFRWQLKGHLFREAWTRRSVTSDMRRHRKTFTYLLTWIGQVVRVIKHACVGSNILASEL